MARTGSTHLCHLLAACPELNVKAELFHPTRPAGRLDADDRWGLHAASNGVVVDRASLTKWRAEHPAETLETLHAVGGGRTLVFKLFPGHLTRERLGGLMARDDVAFAVLTRRPIECYISKLKADAAGIHHSADTTAIRPVLEIEAFLRWAGFARAWYEELAASRVPMAQLSYERHLLGHGSAEALALVLSVLREVGVTANLPEGEPATSAPQDRESDWRRRVENWDVFEDAMRASPERAALLDWALVA
jgi:LPS sulfotransferase NodH